MPPSPPDPPPAAAETDSPGVSTAAPADGGVAPEDRIPVGEKSAYAMGVVSDHFAQFSIHTFLMPFFNVALGIKPSVIGWAMGLARLWDAFNDPIVGNLSDNWRGRLGRRRPFLFVGALLTGLVFPLIWLMPTGWVDLDAIASVRLPWGSEDEGAAQFVITWPLVWLSAALVVYYTAYSMLSVPYESLGMELTGDPQERTNLFAFRTYIMKAFDFLNNWLLPLAMWLAAGMATRELLGEVPALIDAGELDPTLSEEDHVKQMDGLISERTEVMLLKVVPWLAVGVGVFIIISGLLPAIFCRERYQDVAQKQERENPIKSLWSLAGNRPFWVVTGAIAIFLLGIMSSATLGFYVHTYYVCEGDLVTGSALGGLHGTVALVFSIVGAILIQLLSNRIDPETLRVPGFLGGRASVLVRPVIWMSRTKPVAWVLRKPIDKKPLLIGCVAVMLLSTAAYAFTYQQGHPYLTLLTRPFLSVADTGFWVLLISMRADVADWDEYRTGKRREGVIAALGNWQVKLALTVAAVAGAYLLQSWVGFDEELAADQTPETLSRLKWTYVVLPSATITVVLLILLAYPLTRDRLNKVRRELEQRRDPV